MTRPLWVQAPTTDGDHGAADPRSVPRRRLLAAAAVVLGIASAVGIVALRRGPAIPLGVLRVDPADPARPVEMPPLWEHLASLTVVQQLTGPGSPNRTYERWHVGGTDLGFTFLHDGALYMVFGDTYGHERDDWRSNTMAKIAAIDTPAQGLEFERFIADPSGRAAELLSSQKVFWVERTVIPTGGISTGRRMILHYMSVRRWLAPGSWQINHAGLAYSDDDGRTWSKTGPLWDADTNFAQVAFVRDEADPDHVYVFGIPAGRFGGVELARTPAGSLLQIGAYEYWDGTGWTENERGAVRLVPAPVGELSVTWNADLGRWLMMYLNERHGAIVIRTAARLTGPWSEERLITTARDHPQLYAPFIIPLDSADPEIYFTMSRWDSYNVFLIRMGLQ